MQTYFNSLAPRGANHSFTFTYTFCVDFNSLAPRGANLFGNCTIFSLSPFQLTRPAWGEPYNEIINTLTTSISTHSPRVGRTKQMTSIKYVSVNFNSLAPRGANLDLGGESGTILNFNSLAPRGANSATNAQYAPPTHFNSLAPRGANCSTYLYRGVSRNFNSLAPRGAN